jgi:membrane fusion protein, multidrug efflux system
MRIAIGFVWLAICGWAQSLETAKVEQKPVDRMATLTAEVLPFQSTLLTARVQGYIEAVLVDRGSVVKKGQIVARMSAPELQANIAEAEARLASFRAALAEAQAKVAAAESTAGRLREASKTSGAIAANELVQAEETVKAAKAAVDAIGLSRGSAEAQVRAAKDLASFLQLTAPFDGVVTERMLHPGALAGPALGPLLRLEQLNRLRVVVAVPETLVSTVKQGQWIRFKVPGYPGEQFEGRVARVSRVLDPKTRTMPVELEVANPSGRLAPGMYPEVQWPAKAASPTLLVPVTAVASTTERTFVIRVENGVAKYVPVKRGAGSGEAGEVKGDLAAGDVILKRATDEIREGTAIPKK